jgi:hypothetical protein
VVEVAEHRTDQPELEPVLLLGGERVGVQEVARGVEVSEYVLRTTSRLLVAR